MKKTKKTRKDTIKILKRRRKTVGHPEDAANIDAQIRELERRPVEVIVKVIHEYREPEPDTQYKQSHPDEYEWSNFWNDWCLYSDD